MSDLESKKARAREVIRSVSGEMRELSMFIHDHPELNFREYEAHKRLTGYLEDKGFAVTRSAYGMDTAFEAVAGSGSPRIAVLCEYDALPGIGHACGHNLIAISGIATGLALKETLGEGGGTVVVLGTPAEEGGGGKVVMIEEGAFGDIDAAMMVHPSPGDGAYANVIAIQTCEIEYHGKNAHAAAAPWDGVNALDAMVMAYNGISVLRQQMRGTDRVHGVITDGGMKPNIIPDRTAGEFYIRARNRAELEELKRKVVACFEAAATATGCTLELRWTGRAYDDMRTNEVMAERYIANASDLGIWLPSKEQSRNAAPASTDMGNVSYAVPSIHPFFGIPATSGNHTAGFTEAAASEEGHEAAVQAATLMAMTALDLYNEPDLLNQAKDEFRTRVRR
jgi:amidohydrolase